MSLYLLFPYLVLFIFIGFRLIVQNKKMGYVGVYSGFSFGMLVYYVVVPSLVIVNIERIVLENQLYLWFVKEKDTVYFIYSMVLTLFGFVFLNIGYNSTIGSRIHQHRFVDDSRFNQATVLKVFSGFGYFTFIVGGVSFALLLRAFGGVSAALRMAEINRSFATSLSHLVPGRMYLFYVPARLISVSPYLFAVLMFNRRKVSDKVVFVVSFILTIVFYLFNAGKAPLVIFFLSFLIVPAKQIMEKVWMKIVVSGLVMMPLLDVLDELFVFFATGKWEQFQINYPKYVIQFAFPYRNILNVLDMVAKSGLRLGGDFVTAFINFIPGVNFQRSYEQTSWFFYGDSWRVTGGVPNDAITFAYLQFGLLGVGVVFFVLGRIFSRVDEAVQRLPKGPTKDLVLGTLVLNSFFLVSSSDFEAFLRNNYVTFTLFISLFLLRVRDPVPHLHYSLSKRENMTRF